MSLNQILEPQNWQPSFLFLYFQIFENFNQKFYVLP